MKAKHEHLHNRLRVHCFGVSLDGFGAGPDQSVEEPLGVGGEALLLGSGKRLFGGVDALKLGYHCAEHVTTPNATHVVLRKRA